MSPLNSSPPKVVTNPLSGTPVKTLSSSIGLKIDSNGHLGFKGGLFMLSSRTQDGTVESYDQSKGSPWKFIGDTQKQGGKVFLEEIIAPASGTRAALDEGIAKGTIYLLNSDGQRIGKNPGKAADYEDTGA